MNKSIFIFSFLLIFTAILLSGCGIVEKVPDLNKSSWLLLGTFENRLSSDGFSECSGFNRDFLARSGGETGIIPVEGQVLTDETPSTAKIQTIAQTIKTWKKVLPVDNTINLAQQFGGVDFAVAYAFCEFTSSKEETAILKLGSDDGIKVRLNGELIFSRHIHRQLNRDDDILPVRILAGTNRLLLKIEQVKGEWGFFVKLSPLETERKIWNNNSHHNLDIIINQKASNSIEILTEGKPGFSQNEPLSININDFQGNIVSSTNGYIGERISVKLSEEISGVYRVTAVSKNQKELSAKSLLLLGDIDKIRKDGINKALLTAEKFKGMSKNPDIYATCTFLADQLNNKLHPALRTIERNMQAIDDIYELYNRFSTNNSNSGIIPGIHQWAYLSPVDMTCQPYTVYVPESYNRLKKYKLLIALHGYSGEDNGIAKSISQAKPEDFIIAAPFARGSLAYASIGEQDVLEVMDRLTNAYNIDPDRIYIMGISMGGYGTWRFAQLYADRFAAAAAFCGWTGTDYLSNLRNLYTYVFHGDVDPVVSIEPDRRAVSILKKLNYQVHYEELPGVDHDAWNGWIRITKNPSLIFEYLRKHKRNQWPDNVDISASNLRYGKLYWGGIVELENPFKPGKLSLKLVDSKKIKAITENINLFSINLTHPKLIKKGSIGIYIDGETFDAPAGLSNASFLKEEDGWTRIDNEEHVNKAFHTGAGMGDLFYSPVTIVYGTKDRRNTEVLYNTAEKLSDWSVPVELGFACQIGKFQVKSDREIPESELKDRNILLIGSPEENSIISRIADKLPVKFYGRNFEINGKLYENSILILTVPNPWNPLHLITLLYMPVDIRTALAMSQQLPLYLYDSSRSGYSLNTSAIPDLLIINGLSDEKSAAGYFDRNWENLVLSK